MKKVSMSNRQHWAIFITNQSNKQGFIGKLMGLQNVPSGFEAYQNTKGALFSKLTLDKFIEEEVRHDLKILTSETTQSLQSMSSGERKKALLNYLLKANPDFIILDNPFDNLDKESQASLQEKLISISSTVSFIQIISRETDLLPFISKYAKLQGNELTIAQKPENFIHELSASQFKEGIPASLEMTTYDQEYLVQLRKVSVSFKDKCVLKGINWNIKPGEFWELTGNNGSGKTTILSMITGDSPKAYGQDIKLFGRNKGSGESVWDIKKHIGYFTPAMVDRFRGYHTLEHMLVSGLLDSIGLYVEPTEAHLRLADDWLTLLGLENKSQAYFHECSLGEQRLIMCARAMVKHPLLLILDEPTAGLDDSSAAHVVALVNKIAKESHSTLIFVSHRKEPGLDPEYVFRLEMTDSGSIGKVLKKD